MDDAIFKAFFSAGMVLQAMGGSKDPGQLAFEFDGPPLVERPVPTIARSALFFAILPDGDCAERSFRLASDLHREHALSEKPRPLSLLHMTLCPVAQIIGQPENTIALARRAGSGVGGAPFSMKLDEVFSFKQSKKPIVLCAAEGNDAFRMLHIRLARALRNCGLKVPIDRGLRPHMTLAYKGTEIARTKLVAPISLEATEFVLIRSHHGESRHEYVGRWPLPELPPRPANTFS